MTINILKTSEALKSKSSISQLPSNIQSKALRILEIIRRYNLKRKKLQATKLRKEVRMNPNLFCPLFKWLQAYGYCQVNAAITEVSKRKRPLKSQMKLVDITKAGEVAIRKRQSLGNLDQIIEDFQHASSPKQKKDLLYKLFIEVFDLAYSEYYYGGKAEEWIWFNRELEECLQQHLDNEIGDRIEHIHEVYLIINSIPRAPILEDAKRALERGHFLLPNHRYVLHKMEKMAKKDLIDHIIRWKDNVLLPKLRETIHGFPRQTNHWALIEQEEKERNTPQLPRTNYDLIRLRTP